MANKAKVPVKKSGDLKKTSPKSSTPKSSTPKSSTATKTDTQTKTSTSTDAYTQGNITVTGGAGKGSTVVKIGLPGGSLDNNSKKANTAKVKKK